MQVWQLMAELSRFEAGASVSACVGSTASAIVDSVDHIYTDEILLVCGDAYLIDEYGEEVMTTSEAVLFLKEHGGKR